MRRVPWLKAYSVALLAFIFTPVLILVLFSFNSQATASFPIR